ncbi:MAG: ATP-binding cassette domain-containing protein [Verrucomicrobia bacterium]|nr:ATP-binding cassette domain-containing protein [Verrucomicrobiota bacterium]MDA1065186.1 ATP-binding cassette domain-containing protein [Verrucomicrobiota bacterium]
MIEVQSLHKKYGSINAVNGVSFEVTRGEILGFLGPNGAGKSTTMKMITGFIRPTSGKVLVDNMDVQDHPVSVKERIGYMPENGPVYGEMTVEEFLIFISEIRGFDDPTQQEDCIDRVCDLCRLNSVRHQSIETLSKGFKQRVGFAQAVLHDPPVLILDEPTDGLDPNQKKEVRKIIKAMAKDKAIILSTHILEEVSALCTRVIIIAKGQVIADESSESLLKRNKYYNALKIEFEGADLEAVKQALKELPEVAAAEINENSVEVFPKNKQSIETLVLNVCRENNWHVSRFEKRPIGLDEVFWELTA